MKAQMGIFVLVAFFLVPTSGYGGPCHDCLELDLSIEDTNLLAYGVLVGKLEFKNTGESPCKFAGRLSLRAGDLFYELEDPQGNVTKIAQRHHGDMMSVQWATLDPGKSIKHPVCLWKDKGRFLFENEGLYRIRARYETHPIPVVYAGPDARETEPSVRPKKHRLKSNWVDIGVRIAGRGRTYFVDQNKCRTVLEAFGCAIPMEFLDKDLSPFHDYQYEQQKHMLYSTGKRCRGNLMKTQERNEESIHDATLILEYARKVGIGVEMWEWILGRLESFPLDVQGKERFDVGNGYYF